ncbi:MAG TPA: ABC transporter substrate-binding protein, partial [Trueperaceae bacterium]|nr:ABC transporter substrate-binding protein [Trueperaceae bacterium]
MLEGEVRIGVIFPAGQGGDDPLEAAMARAAAHGAARAGDEFTFNAGMLGIDFAVPTVEASGAEAVVAAARELVAEHGAFGVVGGFSAAEAAALATWSSESGVPYLNVGASADSLRNDLCQATMFHVEPSAAMYLDAMAGWYVRSGLRQWYFVRGVDEESSAQLQRINRGLRERHFGVRSVGESAIEVGGDTSEAVSRIERSRADLVVLLLPAHEQLRVLSVLESAGLDVMVTGFPYPEAQTRTFYAASREAAPTLGTGHRVSAWEATLDAYGARELNARYRAAFDEPMDASAWT